jgi:hypothetical protein
MRFSWSHEYMRETPGHVILQQKEH